jgi:hypothetical protein
VSAPTAIVKAIHAGNLDKARAMFRDAARRTTVHDLVMALSAIVEPKPGEITVGLMHLVLGNPFREGWAWRCGQCLHVYRNGGKLPSAGVNYKTQRGAATAARKHSDEEHDGAVSLRELTR